MSPPADIASVIAAVQAALQRQDTPGALALLAEAEAARPTDVQLKLQRALVHRIAGALPLAVEALDEALALDPYDFTALLSKAALVERLAGERAAAKIYRNALDIAPPAEHLLPPGLQSALTRAREVVDRTSRALEAHLTASVKGRSGDMSADARRRFDEALQVFAGRTRVYVHQPLLMHYPKLPAFEFYDRTYFPWFDRLEAATGTIQAELAAVLADPRTEMAPYIAYPAGAPVNQWGELNHSPRWSSYFLWKDGVRQDGACARCPQTAALLASLPLADQPQFAPTAMFSALAPRTHIPAHTGSTNARLLVHLPLVLPGPARFRVGNETRSWRIGEAWAFDDTIEHEAWNDADALRTILIFDVWNPLLEPAERTAITAMMTARKAFYGD